MKSITNICRVYWKFWLSEVASLREKFCQFSLQIDLYQSKVIGREIVISYLQNLKYLFRRANWLYFGRCETSKQVYQLEID